MAPNKKETQTESFKRFLRRTLLNFWERGIFFCLVGFDWAQTVATITSNSQLSQPRPSFAALPAQPEPGAHPLPVSVHAFGGVH